MEGSESRYMKPGKLHKLPLQGQRSKKFVKRAGWIYFQILSVKKGQDVRSDASFSAPELKKGRKKKEKNKNESGRLKCHGCGSERVCVDLSCRGRLFSLSRILCRWVRGVLGFGSAVFCSLFNVHSRSCSSIHIHS